MLDVAKLGGVVSEPGAKLCDIIFAVAKAVCKCSDAEALHIISQRLAARDVSGSFSEALLDIDEAAQVMDKADVKLLKYEQERESTNN